MKNVFVKCILIALLIIAQLGCATNAPNTPSYYANEHESFADGIKSVALVTSSKPPVIEHIELGVTHGKGATRGAGIGALSGADAALDAMQDCSGDFCGVTLLLLPVFMVGGALVGAVSGSAEGYSADVLADAELKAQQLLDSAYLQTELLKEAERYGNDNLEIRFIRLPETNSAKYLEIENNNVSPDKKTDLVLKIDLLRMSFEYSLEIDIRARLISAKTSKVLSDNDYKYLSERRQLEEWMKNGAQNLNDAIQQGLKTLAEDAIDENFLLFYPRMPVAHNSVQSGDVKVKTNTSRDARVPHYALSPLYPELDYCFICEKPLAKRPHRAIANLEFVELDSVHPILRWESFPRDYDLTDVEGRQNKITNVSYDLKIFNAGRSSRNPVILLPAKLIYDVRGLSEPHHKIENALNECTDYFWTVRAKFKLNDRMRVTEWSGAFDVIGSNEKPWNLRRDVHAYEMPKIFMMSMPDGPEWYYYPFMTPCN